MASKGQHDPNSLRSRIARWLDDNPGLHSCQDIAKALNTAAARQRNGPRAVSTHQVAIAARGLWETGRAVRGVRTYGSAPKPREGATA